MSRDQRVRDRDPRDRDYADRDFDRVPKRRKEDRVYSDHYDSSNGSSRDRERPIERTGERPGERTAPLEYRTLCVSNLNPRVPDVAIKEALFQEFEKFGDFNVKVVHNDEFRIAYINFRYPEDARNAKRARLDMILFDMPVRIDPVYNQTNVRSGSPEYVRGGSYSHRSASPNGQGRASYGRSFSAGGGREAPPRREYQNYDSSPPIRVQQPQEREHHREHKFPHHLHHVRPEEDDKATRTLFVGNLDVNILEDDLRRIFERYGDVEDVDIKKPAKGQGNAYAFVKFMNLDMAHRSKVDLSGQYLGKFQCKIGYGKVNPTTCIWVGGIGPWVSNETLAAEFDRFGVIHRIDWPHGKNYAYILYDNIDAAQAAIQEMRGFPLGGPERRLRVDFADPNHMGLQSQSRSRNSDPPARPAPTQERAYNRDDDQWRGSRGRSGPPRSSSRGEWTGAAVERGEGYRSPENARDPEWNRQRRDMDGGTKFENQRYHGGPESDGYRTRQPHDRAFSPPLGRDPNLSPHNKRARMSAGDEGHNGRDVYPERDHQDRSRMRESGLYSMGSAEYAENVSELAKCLPVVWSGALVLKNSAFATCMHLVSGDVHLVDTLMRDPTTTEMPVLKITQRLRLDQPKLDEVSRRVESSGSAGHSVLLAMPGNVIDDPNAPVQQRPLKNLVSYLKQKDAAGVIPLPPNPGKARDCGVLHAFPPCTFGNEFLSKRASKLHTDPAKDEHMIIIVIGGPA